MNIPSLDWMAIIAAIIVIAGIFGGGWVKYQNGTMQLIKDQNVELVKSNVLLKNINVDMASQLTMLSGKLCTLEGVVETLKGIPLVNIDITLKEIAKFNKGLLATNGKILHQLQIDAASLEHETALTTEAVFHVKDDLAHKDDLAKKEK